MHLVSELEDLRLVSGSLGDALLLGHLVVVHELVAIVGMGAVLDNALGSLSGRQSTQIGESLLGDDHVEIVLGVIDVRGHGHDAGDTRGIGLALARRGRVHDGQIGVAEEVARAAEAVDHLGAAHQRGVRVRVHVHLHRRVHRHHAQAAHDLREVRDGLGADHAAALVEVQVLVEALEAGGGERQRHGGGVVELARVEEVEHGVLQDFRPD